jgi:hypothetical protein
LAQEDQRLGMMGSEAVPVPPNAFAEEPQERAIHPEPSRQSKNDAPDNKLKLPTPELPSLAKEGTTRHRENVSVPLKGADRIVHSTIDNRGLEPSTPSAPAKEASPHRLIGRSRPSFAKEGNSEPPVDRQNMDPAEAPAKSPVVKRQLKENQSPLLKPSASRKENPAEIAAETAHAPKSRDDDSLDQPPSVVIGRIHVEVIPPQEKVKDPERRPAKPLTAESASVIGALSEGVRANRFLSLRYR